VLLNAKLILSGWLMKRDLMGGINAVEALLLKAPERVIRLWIKSGSARLEPLRARAVGLGIPIEETGDLALSAQLPNFNHQGIIAEFQPRPPIGQDELVALVETVDNPVVLVLDGIQDPQNLGACMRSAQAAGAVAVVTTKDKAVGLTPAARKASAGASEVMPLAVVTNLARTLKSLQDTGLWVIGLEMGEPESLFSRETDEWLRGPVALVIGGEGEGMRSLTRKTCDRVVSIPMPGGMESLNASVSAALVLFSMVRARSPELTTG
jgi:23S rRNA (guanosine2251-2'-O)-methyltransferase